MLSRHITSGLSEQKDAVRFLAAIAKELGISDGGTHHNSSAVLLSYAESEKRVQGQPRVPTGRKTLVIELNGGSPEVAVSINEEPCCGG